MRHYLLLAWLVLLAAVIPATAQVSVGIGIATPNVSIGINVPAYPRLVRVPGHPVYYAPGVQANFFFYDGLYWVYDADNWYASSWYNGPWQMVEPTYVPVFILRVPVRYYRHPPRYFGGWRRDRPPRWDDHWGHDWSEKRRGWQQWNRPDVPRAAPLPRYQQRYRGDQYPRETDRQRDLRERNYRYQPRDEMVRRHYQERPRRDAGPGDRRPNGGPPGHDRGDRGGRGEGRGNQ